MARLGIEGKSGGKKCGERKKGNKCNEDKKIGCKIRSKIKGNEGGNKTKKKRESEG